MKSNLRIAHKNDAKALLDIYRPYILETAITFENEIPPAGSFAERIETVLRQFPWLVCEADGQVAGYAYAAPHRARTAYQWSVESSVYIAPAYHRYGIGKELYDALLGILKIQGYYNVYAGITLPNPKSEGFHRKYGFEPVGTYKNVGFKLGRWHDVQWLSLTLAPYPEKPDVPILFQELAGSAEINKLLGD